MLNKKAWNMKAAIYRRLSEEDKGKADGADSGSIQNQKLLLTPVR